MNYVGRFLSNFKGFYNDINSATLTGAIDVLVVRQEDGSFASSPWHVRFGKMGVMRAREKVVDVEINGGSVNLCMKLGEAGEAFFVQEVNELTEFPTYLSTSPINSHLDSYKDDFDVGRDVRSVDYFEETNSEMLGDLQCNTVIRIDGDNITVSEVPKSNEACGLDDEEDGQPGSPPGSPVENVTQDNNQYFSAHCKYDLPRLFAIPKVHDVSTQTDMSAHDVEAKKSKSRNSSGENFPISSRYDMTLEPIISCTSVDGKEEKIFSKEIENSDVVLEVTEVELPNTDVVMPVEECDDHLDRESLKNIGNEERIRGLEEEMFDLELSDEEEINSKRFISLTDCNQQRVVSTYLGPEEWVSSQYASTCHPFSDTDITPGTSPLGSRPTSPKSDSGFETQKYDATAQTQLTGDELLAIDDIKWEWGEFPQATPTSSQPQLPIISDNLSKKKKVPTATLR